MLAWALRGTAWAIAIVALIDPVLTVERAAPVRLRVVTVPTASLDLPVDASGETRGEALAADMDALDRRLGSQYEVRHVEAVAGATVDWCAGADACLVAGDDTAAPAGTSVTVPHVVLVVDETLSPNVAVRSVLASPTQHGDAFGRVRASLEGHGVEGQRTNVRVMDGTQARGETIHEWTAGESVADVLVQWWSAGEGARLLTVEAVPITGELSTLDNTAQTVVHVSRTRLPVLVYEPRPSWATTFVRRALENDPRLQVEARSRVSPRTAVTTPEAPALTPRALEDVALVVVGGLDALPQADALLLQQFVTRRGGSLLLLPDSLPAGRAAALVPGRLRERLVALPAGVGPLRATELALTAAPAPVDRVLAALDDGTPVVVESPIGHGRIVVSGAMDAWRHRGDGEPFDGFWQGLAARLAADAGTPFRVSPRATLAGPGERVAFQVIWRTLTEDEGTWPPLTAWMTCEGASQRPLTVWPEAAPGTYRVEAAHAAPGRCAVEVAPVSRPARSQTADLEVVDGRMPRPPHQPGALTALARSRGGAVVKTGQVNDLAAAVGATVMPRLESHDRRPLRAPWWILLFAGALGGEWWVRRSRGLR